MNQERDTEQAGAPVEQAESTDTQLLAAVERAAEVPAPETNAAAESSGDSHRPVIAEQIDPPSAGETESASDIFAAHKSTSSAGEVATASNPAVGLDSIFADSDDTETQGETSATVAAPSADQAAQATAVVPPTETKPVPDPVRDGEIRISADHPMAALYMQSPVVPDRRGNRGAGVLISLLATVAFALLYAGVIALWLAPNFPPSTFLDDGLLPSIMNWGFAAAVVGFFIGLSLLVLIVGRAGWWAYALGGLLVALFTWGIALGGFALNARLVGESVNVHVYTLLVDFGLFFPVLAAGIVAREVSVWFGAWIGFRGRKMKRLNAEALAEYEQSMAEAQAKQP